MGWMETARPSQDLNEDPTDVCEVGSSHNRGLPACSAPTRRFFLTFLYELPD